MMVMNVTHRNALSLQLILGLSIVVLALTIGGTIAMFWPQIQLGLNWQRGVQPIVDLGGSVPARWTAAAQNGWVTAEEAAAGINLDRSKVTDSDLAVLKNFKNVYSVSLKNTAITDAGLLHLKAMPALTVANLEGTAVSEEARRELESFLTRRADEKSNPNALAGENTKPPGK